MKLVQPKPIHTSSILVPEASRIRCQSPVYFVRYRYPHHAAPSGYDRLCDYIGETIDLQDPLYWAGELWMRPYCLAQAHFGGHYEYSRYDCVMEMATIKHYREHSDSIYHFIYAEKSYKLMARFAGQNRNLIVGSVHHPPEHMQILFKTMDHFRTFDHLLVMTEDQIPFWQAVTGRENVHFLPHGVDTTHFSPAVPKNLQNSTNCIFIGKHERDFFGLEQIIDQVTRTYPFVRFDLISGNAFCGALASKYPNVHWHSRVSDVDYLTLLKNADIMTLPLLRSTACNAVLEALACGIPVITNLGGIDSYLTSDCSVRVPTGDYTAFVSAIFRWIEDDNSRQKAGNAARQHALSLSWEAVAKQLSSFYENWI